MIENVFMLFMPLAININYTARIFISYFNYKMLIISIRLFRLHWMLQSRYGSPALSFYPQSIQGGNIFYLCLKRRNFCRKDLNFLSPGLFVIGYCLWPE